MSGDSYPPKILMAVYNSISNDGRVSRAALSLSSVCNVVLLGVAKGQKAYLPGVEVQEVHLRMFGHIAIIRLLAFWARVLMILLTSRPTLFYAHDYFLALPAWIARQFLGIKVVYDAHELIVPDITERIPFRMRIFYYCEMLAVRQASVIIAANEERAAIMEKHYHLKMHPLIIHNCTLWLDTDHSRFNDKSVVNDKCRIIYQGLMSSNRGIGLFIDAMSYLGDDFELLLVGDGPDLKRFEEQIKSNRVTSRVKIYGRVSKDALWPIMNRCDIGIISYSHHGLNNIYCAPNKIYEYANAGLAIVATSQPPLQKMVVEHRLGVVCFQGETIEETIRNYVHSIRQAATNHLEYLPHLKHFAATNSWDQEAEKLLLNVGRILSEKRSQ